MEYRILGKTGLKVSRLGLGGIPIQRTDKESAKKLLQAAREAGINFIDSARGYTVSEEYIGNGISGMREHFVLATKSMSRTKEAMARDIDISLKNFQTDYIDLYQIHNLPMRDVDKVLVEDGALAALMEAKAEGKIGHIGVTTHSAATFEHVLEFDWVETLMLPFNFIEKQEEELIAKCHKKNIGFIDMKPLAGGALDDATLALRFLFSNDNIDLVIPGMAEVEELIQNLSAAEDGSPLTQAELEKIEEVRRTLGTEFCRRCNYCAPCTVGIDIPRVFTFEGYYRRYGLTDWSKGRYLSFPAVASDCIECGACESRCPYNLPIRKMLKRVVDAFGK